jgi:hypothetical protein
MSQIDMEEQLSNRRLDMILPSSDFHRRVINTDNIVIAGNVHLIPSLFNKYPGDYIDVDLLNNLRAQQSYTIPKTTIRNIYGEYSYGTRPFGSSAPSQANITIQNITVGGTSCLTGCTITCVTGCPAIVNIIVTWINSGSSNGTFTPTITVAGGTSIPGTQIMIAPGGTGTTTFLGVSLPQGTPSVCFDTGIIT